jgi:wobble nucleotide-excising tRNase
MNRRRVTARLRSLRLPAVGDTAGLEARLTRIETEQRETRERLDRLESVIEGVQDAMHRETVRQQQLIDDLERKTEPAEMARALSDDARRRGL